MNRSLFSVYMNKHPTQFPLDKKSTQVDQRSVRERHPEFIQVFISVRDHVQPMTALKSHWFWSSLPKNWAYVSNILNTATRNTKDEYKTELANQPCFQYNQLFQNYKWRQPLQKKPFIRYMYIYTYTCKMILYTFTQVQLLIQCKNV